MIKGTPELIAGRREEIVNACERLYETMSFGEITLKEIAAAVPFSRPTIYNYFQTKEEIFLALYTREYDRWNRDLDSLRKENDALTHEEFADRIAKTLEKRVQLLKLLSMNTYDMEANSRLEMLTGFKASYGKSVDNLRAILRVFCPEMTDDGISGFLRVFYPFMFGIYPYAAVTPKQREAMAAAGVRYFYPTVYELTRACILRLLGDNIGDEA